MSRSLIALLASLAVLASPGQPAADTCDDVARFSGPPVYVLMFGYPHSPRPKDKTLEMVDEDLLRMDRFFQALGPTRMWVHGEPEGNLLARFGADGLRPTTWRALRESVGELVGAVGAEPVRPQVYVYFSGHGETNYGRLLMYGRPEPGATDPGFNGYLDSSLIAREILHPLAGHADVHVIADTCFSYFLLSTRGKGMVRLSRVKGTPPELVIDREFAADLPRVGALLATTGYASTAYENGRDAGIFSHALRSLAMGPADLNHDGIVTYGEMDFALAWVSEGTLGLERPGIVAPGLDPQTPFIDWRSAPAARVCIPPSLAGRRYLFDRGELLATVHLPAIPLPLWLPAGETFGLVGGDAPSHPGKIARRDFVARDGALAITEVSPMADSRGDPYGDFFPTPIVATGYDPDHPIIEHPLRPYYALAALVGGAYGLGEGPVEGAAWGGPHVDLALRLGLGHHRGHLELGYAGWSVASRTADGEHRPALTAHAVGGRLGYGYLLTEGAWEVDLGPVAGLRGGFTDADDQPRIWLPEAGLRASVLRPFGARSPWAWRIDAQVGAMYIERVAPSVRISVGLDYEDGFE